MPTNAPLSQKYFGNEIFDKKWTDTFKESQYKQWDIPTRITAEKHKFWTNLYEKDQTN